MFNRTIVGCLKYQSRAECFLPLIRHSGSGVGNDQLAGGTHQLRCDSTHPFRRPRPLGVIPRPFCILHCRSPSPSHCYQEEGMQMMELTGFKRTILPLLWWHQIQVSKMSLVYPNTEVHYRSWISAFPLRFRSGCAMHVPRGLGV